jgi:hypothetical protein
MQKVNPGGYYIIEDLDESRSEDYKRQVEVWRRSYTNFRFEMLKIPSLIGVSNMLIVAQRTAA